MTRRIQDLLTAEAKLEALEAGGVDNWNWYEDSLSDHFKEPTEDDIQRTLKQIALEEND